MELTLAERAKLVESARNQFMTAIALKEQFITRDYLDTLVSMSNIIAQSLAQGGKLMLCGNGGSAADAQHLATELLVRLHSHVNREALPAISLVLDPSSITACANDYGFEYVFERMVQALGKPGDILLGLTTSGRSKNIIRALQAARDKSITTLGFLGDNGGQTIDKCDLSLVVPSADPNRVQEVHITMGHVLLDLVETLMLARKQVNFQQSLQTEATPLLT